MVFVDTSVWIAFFRGGDAALTRRLRALLDEDRVALAAPVWIELLSGAGRKDGPLLKSVLSALPRFYPTRNTWKTLEAWTSKAGRKGQRFGAMDLLVAAIARENEGKVWTLDSDFDRLAGLKLVSLVPR